MMFHHSHLSAGWSEGYNRREVTEKGKDRRVGRLSDSTLLLWERGLEKK